MPCSIFSKWSLQISLTFSLGMFSSSAWISFSPMAWSPGRRSPSGTPSRSSGVGMAAVLNLPALAQAHKAVAGAALPVTGGAEGGNISQLHQPFYHFIQGAVVADVELLGVVRTLLLGVAAHAGAAAADTWEMPRCSARSRTDWFSRVDIIMPV